MEKFYQGWAERDDGSMGLVVPDATTVEECEKRTLELIQQCGQQEPKASVLYVCIVEPMRRMSMEPVWTDV